MSTCKSAHMWRHVASVGDSTTYRCEFCERVEVINDKAGFDELERRGGDDCSGGCSGKSALPPVSRCESIFCRACRCRSCAEDRATLKRLEDNVKSLCHEIAGLRKHLGMIAHE
jgi:hypothetical protein